MMKIETKYGSNDKVILIRNRPEKWFEECSACSGKGHIILNDLKVRTCPECYGRKIFERYGDHKWLITGELTIGKVTAEITNIESDGMFDNVGHYKDGKTINKFQYMAYESGIGSGSIYYEEDLFSTEEEALAECAKRNES